MKILIINSGSSSLKYKLFDMGCGFILAKGTFEKIGSRNGIITYENYLGINKKFEKSVENREIACNLIKNFLLDPKIGVLNNLEELAAIGHRIVHGGTLTGPLIVNDNVLSEIEKLIPLSPLHNSFSIKNIKACIHIFGKNVLQVVAFDTSFHNTMPEKAYMYALPYECYEKYKIRKYGFHGFSHYYVSKRCAHLLNKDTKNIKIITCHLGSGASITAIKNGESIDTSMGFTPGSGLMMCTRCGDLDPGIVLYLLDKLKINKNELNKILNEKSGLLGISGISDDFREIIKEAKLGKKRAILAYEMFNYRIIKYIGAYIAVLGGCDAIVFTGEIGENDPESIKSICNAFSFMGVHIDENFNEKITKKKEKEISKKDSSIKIYIIPTNEELIIARDVKNLINSLNNKITNI